MLVPVNAAFIAALFALVAGAPIASNSTGGVIALPLKKDLFIPKIANGTHSALTRRETESTNLVFNGVRYFVDYEIGGQTQSAILDTGSADVWTFSNKAWSGGYDPTKSSTYHWLNDDFSDAYGDGSTQVSGVWALDDIKLGGADVPQHQFAYLNQTDPNFPDNRGIFGVGPQGAQSEIYTSFLNQLKQSGEIESNSFSIYTNSALGSEATLLLGGIDETKFKGELYTLPFSTNFFMQDYYSIDFTFQGTQYSGGVLDTGTPYVLLPQSIADSVASQYGAEWSNDQQCYVLPSGTPPSNLPGLDFDIGGLTVTIPGDEMFVDYEGIYMFAISRDLNELGIQLNVLGDPILRQLFLLFDNDKSEVAYAPVAYSDSSELVSVGSDVPDSEAAPDQSTSSSGCVIC